MSTASQVASTYAMGRAPHELLTDKQREIFELLLDGLSTTQIGHRLSRTPGAVSIGKRLIFKRLGVASLVQLGAYAEKRGLMFGRRS